LEGNGRELKLDRKRNYQRELDSILEREESRGKRLFLHSCCAPCSSYVLVYLRHYFQITVFYYNPNITEREEYEKRAAEQKRLIRALNGEREAGFLIQEQEAVYEPDAFFKAVQGLERCPEGGERCRRCFLLRLEETARRAGEQGYDYFTTTLTLSPLKNAALLNEIGEAMAAKYGVAFLPSDFKKREGYKQSVELSRTYGLYRQDYCGCVFSKAQRHGKDCLVYGKDS